MANVKSLHLHYFDKRKKQRETIQITPSSQNPVSMKLDVAKELAKIRSRVEYYYVVVEVEKGDGTPGYRTIVPKTVVA